jgi:hypothetical protein
MKNSWLVHAFELRTFGIIGVLWSRELKRIAPICCFLNSSRVTWIRSLSWFQASASQTEKCRGQWDRRRISSLACRFSQATDETEVEETWMSCRSIERISHLTVFGSRPKLSSRWKNVFRWLILNLILPPSFSRNEFSLMTCLSSY